MYRLGASNFLKRRKLYGCPACMHNSWKPTVNSVCLQAVQAAALYTLSSHGTLNAAGSQAPPGDPAVYIQEQLL